MSLRCLGSRLRCPDKLLWGSGGRGRGRVRVGVWGGGRERRSKGSEG